MPFDTIAKFARSKKKEAAKKTERKPEKKEAKKEEIKKEMSFFSAVFSVIKMRRSIRKFQSRPVSNDIVNILLEAAREAPSAGNQQPWEFVVVRDLKTRQDITKACFNQKWMAEAPVFIIVGINMRLAEAIFGERGEKLYGIQAVAAAIENMLLTATSLNLGTCWVSAFSEPEVTFAVGFPEYIRPCAVIPVGYPAEKPEKPLRHYLKDFVFYERYKENPKYLQ